MGFRRQPGCWLRSSHTSVSYTHLDVYKRQLDTLRKNGNMTLYTLEKICKALDCNPEEVVEFTDDEDNSSERE